MWLPGFSRDFSRVLRGSRTSEFIICNLIYVKMAVSFEIFCYSPVAHALRHYLVPNGGVDAWENHKGPLALFDGNVWLFSYRPSRLVGVRSITWQVFAFLRWGGGLSCLSKLNWRTFKMSEQT
jgi:hypothetical protein